MRVGRVVKRDAMVDPRTCDVRCAVVALESIPPGRSRTRKPINPLYTRQSAAWRGEVISGRWNGVHVVLKLCTRGDVIPIALP